MNSRTGQNRARSSKAKAAELAVMPLAMKHDPESTEAVIPASIKDDSGHAVIEAEIKKGGKSRRRTAVVPGAVQTRLEAYRASRPLNWRSVVREGVGSLIEAEQNALELAFDYGLKLLGLEAATSEPEERPKSGRRQSHWPKTSPKSRVGRRTSPQRRMRQAA